MSDIELRIDVGIWVDIQANLPGLQLDGLGGAESYMCVCVIQNLKVATV